MSKATRAASVSVLLSHTRAPHPTYVSILFEDGKPAFGVCIKVESSKDYAGQA